MQKYKLGDICFIQSGNTPDRSIAEYYESSFIPWAKVGDLEEGKTLSRTEEFISESGLNSIGHRVFEKGTLLLALYGSTLGKTAIADIRLSCNQAILGINTRNTQILLNPYLKYWFDYNKERIVFRQKGGAQKNLNKGYVEKLNILLPPVDEQQRSVEILESIQEIISNRNKTIEFLDEYLKNIFLEMFLENSRFDPTSKYWGKINDVIEASVYGTAEKANTEMKGVPIIRMNNITSTGELDLVDLKWVELDQSLTNTFELQDGDILFNRTNSKELVGKTAVWDKGSGYAFAGYLVKLILYKDKMTPYYFSGFMNSHFGKKILFNKAKSSGSQVNFSPPLLKNQKILIPPIDLQRKYDEIYRSIKLQKQSLQKSLTLLQELFTSITFQIFGNDKPDSKEEIDILMQDDIQLELFLNTINASDFQSEELYSIEIEKLFKILDRTDKGNLDSHEFKKGIIQRLANKKIVLEANREYKNRLIDEAIST